MNYAHVGSKTGGRKTQFWYEYAFHQAVDGINQRRMDAGEPVIVVSKAKRLRKNILQQLSQSDVDFTDAKTDDFKKALNDVLAPENNGRPIFSDDENGKKLYNQMFYNFAKETGFKELKGVNTENSVIPLSPYDSRFTNRATFMKNGSSLLYIDADNINLETGKFVNNDNPPLYKKSYDGGLDEIGDFTTQDDKSGMARLLRFIPEKDYESLADWVNSAPEDQYMSRAAVDRSVAILSYLQDNGYDYEITKDRNYGQLKANIKGTKMNIRISDTKNNDAYVGSVYNNGDRIYFATTPSQQKPQVNIEPVDSVNLVRFARGESVMRRDINQPVGSYGTYQSGKYPRPNSYHTDKGGYSAIYKSVKDATGRDTFDKVTIHIDNKRGDSNLRFEDGNQAEEYLRGIIKSARDTFVSQIDVDMLVKEARKHAGDEDYTPQLSGDNGIAAIQQSYWEILTGKQGELLKAGLTAADYTEAKKNNEDVTHMFYDGEAEEKIRAHLADTTDNLFGQYEQDIEGKRFNPSNVAKYMTSGNGIYRNNDNIITAMKTLDMSADELKGDEYNVSQIKNRLIKFDKNTAKPMYQSSNPFIQSMFETIKTTLSETGCDIKDKDILMDDNGIVQYAGTRTKNWRNPTQEPIKGEIGQIFVPDGLGMVRTKFASGDDYIFVPGYNATVVPQKDGENLSLEERTRLHGYEQEMKSSIAYQLRSDLMNTGSEFGETTSINNVHHRMYDTRYPVDVIERAVSVDGMRKDIFDATIKTLARRVRYSNDFKEGSTINADYQANRNTGFNDLTNDNYADPYRLSGRRNMSVMTEDSFGYFDPYATSTSTNQGIVRFLTESAQVDSDGKIIKGDENDKTPLMKIPEMRYSEYSPFDRIGQMVFSNLLTARAVVNDVHTTQMTFGGWTMDDGKVVSKDFAEKHPIRGTDGKLRPLTTGDKLCDFGGNKGVISLVVDPDMDLEEAKKQGIETEVKWFKINKEQGNNIDIVEAPFTSVSRFNGTSDKMLMEHPMDLLGPDGTVYEGCLGTTSYIITDMPVDEKTHIYGDDELAEGKGRKASSQLAWALASHDATRVLDEFYSSNSTATANLRETMITMGLDISEKGELRDHYEPHEGEKRQVFEMPELEYRETKNGKYLNLTKMRQDFGNLIQNQGGIMELPFPLKYPTGDITPPLNDGKTDVVYTQQEWERKGYYRKDGTYVKPTTVKRRVESSQRSGGEVTYGLPVLSSYLRSGQEFDDGTVSRHDYTNNYQAIYEAACKYRDEKSKGDSCDEMKLQQYQNEAQRSYSQITMDLQQRKFDNNKHNIFKDEIMSHRLSHSATAVWTADPRLDIDQIAMGPETAASLDVKEGDYVMCWRDPALRKECMSYDRVHIVDNLIGIAINPVMAPIKDGDFDGDSAGVAKVQTKEAQREAFAKITAASNLLNKGILNKDEHGNESYSVFIQDGLDMASSYFARPELKEQRAEIEARINAFESDSSLNPAQLMKERQQAVKDLSEHVRATLSQEFGTDMISYKDPESHLRSIARTVDHGAKGNYKKLGDFMKYMGWQADMITEDGKPVGIDFSTLKDTGHTLATYQDAKNTMYATAIKSFGTGVAGKYSQRGMSVLRDICPTAVLEMTYPNTQGILQAKHDPDDARHRYEMLMVTARDLWRGYKLDKSMDSDGMTHWTTVRDPQTKKPEQATPEEFRQQFMDVYGKEGLDCKINEHYIDDITKALTGEDGKIINMEKTRVEGSSTLDRLTYGGGFTALVEAAKNNENLFDGKYTQHFAPSSIRKNQQAMNDYGDEQSESKKTVKAITKSDTREVTQPKKPKSDMAVTVSGQRRLPDVPDGETAESAKEVSCAGSFG